MFKSNEDIINDIVNGVELEEAASEVVNRDADVIDESPAICGNCEEYCQKRRVCGCPLNAIIGASERHIPCPTTAENLACMFWRLAIN